MYRDNALKGAWKLRLQSAKADKCLETPMLDGSERTHETCGTKSLDRTQRNRRYNQYNYQKNLKSTYEVRLAVPIAGSLRQVSANTCHRSWLGDARGCPGR